MCALVFLLQSFPTPVCIENAQGHTEHKTHTKHVGENAQVSGKQNISQISCHTMLFPLQYRCTLVCSKEYGLSKTSKIV